MGQGFYISQHIPREDARVKKHPHFMGENIFPEGFSAADMKDPTETYYDAVFQLSLKVLQILARGLPYGEAVFDEFVSNDPLCTLRLLHYPPAASGKAGQPGAGAHTDFGRSLSVTHSNLLCVLIPWQGR